MVPAAIDHIMLLRQAWMRMVKATPRSWAMVSVGMPKVRLSAETVSDAMKEIFFRQYITKRAKTDAGKTLPRYMMYLGVGLPGRNTMKGMKRVSIVAKTPAATIATCCHRGMWVPILPTYSRLALLVYKRFVCPIYNKV